jgi:hypothetical protein
MHLPIRTLLTQVKWIDAPHQVHDSVWIWPRRRRRVRLKDCDRDAGESDPNCVLLDRRYSERHGGPTYSLVIGTVLTGTGMPSGCTITCNASYPPGGSLTGSGGTGTYQVNPAPSSAVSGETMTLTGVNGFGWLAFDTATNVAQGHD